MGGSLGVSRLLVQKGADVHSWSNDDRTPLHTASQRRYLDVVRLLIDNNWDVKLEASGQRMLDSFTFESMQWSS